MVFVWGKVQTNAIQTLSVALLKCLQLPKSEECYNFTQEFGGSCINYHFTALWCTLHLERRQEHLIEVALHGIAVKTCSESNQLNYKGELKGALYK